MSRRGSMATKRAGRGFKRPPQGELFLGGEPTDVIIRCVPALREESVASQHEAIAQEAAAKCCMLGSGAGGAQGAVAAAEQTSKALGAAAAAAAPAAGQPADDARALALSGAMELLRLAVRSNVKLSEFHAQLTSANFPATFIEHLTRSLRQRRKRLQSALQASMPSFPRLQGLRWRVDVEISSSHLMRVMRPSVMVEMRLTDGSIRTVSMSLEQLHELRYQVAHILRDMGEIPRRPIMRITADAQRVAAKRQNDMDI